MATDILPDFIPFYSLPGNGDYFTEPHAGAYFTKLKKDYSIKAYFERIFNVTLLMAYSEKPVTFIKNSADIGNNKIVLLMPNGSKMLFTNSEWGDIDYTPPPQKKKGNQDASY
jgi:hypothetical protein